MYRLFVAVVPPEPVRAALTDLMGGVTGARWQRDDQLHMTLRFIGEVDRHTATDVAAALGGVRHPPFDAAVAGFGTFATRGRANALWAGVTPVAAVTALHNKVDQALSRAGIAPDTRAFHPHITLARLGRASGAIGDFVAAAQAPTGHFRVNDFALIESILTRDGADYTVVETYALKRFPGSLA